MEDDVRRRVPGRLDDVPGSEVRLDLDTLDEVAVRLNYSLDADPLPAPRLLIAAQRVRRHAALAGDLDAAAEHPVGILGRARHVRVVRVHPELAAGGVYDRARQSVVVRV